MAIFLGDIAQPVLPLETISTTRVDNAQNDFLGRLRISATTLVFKYLQEYGMDTHRYWDMTANGTIAVNGTNASVTNGGNLVGPTNSATRMCPITVSSTSGHYSVLQSKMYIRGIPGRGTVMYISGIFAAGPGSTNNIVLRSGTSGLTVDTSFDQTTWNVDRFDGSGPSKIIIDFTKINTLVIDPAFSGAGRIRIGFLVNGFIFYAHTISTSNNVIIPAVQSSAYPIRMEARTGSTTTSTNTGVFDAMNGIFLSCTRSTTGGTIQYISASADADGAKEQFGNPTATPTGIFTTSVTTRRPVLSIRPSLLYNGKTNRTLIEDAQMAMRVSTNDCYFEMVYGGVLTGASFLSVGSYSSAEYDVAATSITGGIVIAAGSSLSGSVSKAELFNSSLDSRIPLVLSQIDALAATQTTLSLVCTAYTGTSNITPTLQWQELSS